MNFRSLYNTQMANPLELYTPREVVEQQGLVDVFWEEKVKTLTFYHATSSNSIDSIRIHGVSPNQKPYLKSDVVTLAAISNQVNFGDGSYYVDTVNSGNVYVGTDLPRCIEYAQAGSEFMREMLSEIDFYLQRPFILSQSHPVIVNPAALLMDIKFRFDCYFSTHRPALLVINPLSNVIRSAIQRDYPHIYAWMYHKEAFIEEVKRYSSHYAGDQEESAWGVLDQIQTVTNDLAVDGIIPPSDFQVIEPDDFPKFLQDFKSSKKQI